MSVVCLDRVTKGFGGAPILGDVSLRVGSGDFVVVVGRSGCGKSTLLRLVAGLEVPDTGVVTVAARPVDGPAPDRGMVFQSFALFPWLTVARHVEFAMRSQRLAAAEARDRVSSLLRVVGLEGKQDRYPHQLSGGEQQRVAIVRCLAARPAVVLMDEPFGSLDAFTREEIQVEMLSLWHAMGLTVLFVTHDIREAVFLGRRIVVLGGSPAGMVEDLCPAEWSGGGGAQPESAPAPSHSGDVLSEAERARHARRPSSVRLSPEFIALERHLGSLLGLRREVTEADGRGDWA